MSLHELDEYLSDDKVNIFKELDAAIDSMERGDLIPHEKTMELLWEEVYSKIAKSR